MIPLQNVSLGQNAHRSFTAIETIHNSTVQEVNCREYHTAHSVAQHINNWRSFLLFATCLESYRSYAETILTSNPFSPKYVNSKRWGYKVWQVENLQFHTDITSSHDGRRYYTHGSVEWVKVTRLLHWRWRHDCRTIITSAGRKKKTPTVAGKRMIQPLHLVGRKWHYFFDTESRLHSHAIWCGKMSLIPADQGMT